MANIGNTVVAEITLAKNERLTSLMMPLANTEYNFPLQPKLLGLNIYSKTKQGFKLSFVLGDSGTNFWPVPKGNVYSLAGINFTDKILYVQSTFAAQELVIEELW